MRREGAGHVPVDIGENTSILLINQDSFIVAHEDGNSFVFDTVGARKILDIHMEYHSLETPGCLHFVRCFSDSSVLAVIDGTNINFVTGDNMSTHKYVIEGQAGLKFRRAFLLDLHVIVFEMNHTLKIVYFDDEYRSTAVKHMDWCTEEEYQHYRYGYRNVLTLDSIAFCNGKELVISPAMLQRCDADFELTPRVLGFTSLMSEDRELSVLPLGNTDGFLTYKWGDSCVSDMTLWHYVDNELVPISVSDMVGPIMMPSELKAVDAFMSLSAIDPPRRVDVVEFSMEMKRIKLLFECKRGKQHYRMLTATAGEDSRFDILTGLDMVSDFYLPYTPFKTEFYGLNPFAFCFDRERRKVLQGKLFPFDFSAPRLFDLDKMNSCAHNGVFYCNDNGVSFFDFDNCILFHTSVMPHIVKDCGAHLFPQKEWYIASAGDTVIHIQGSDKFVYLKKDQHILEEPFWQFKTNDTCSLIGHAEPRNLIASYPRGGGLRFIDASTGEINDIAAIIHRFYKLLEYKFEHFIFQSSTEYYVASLSDGEWDVRKSHCVECDRDSTVTYNADRAGPTCYSVHNRYGRGESFDLFFDNCFIKVKCKFHCFLDSNLVLIDTGIFSFDESGLHSQLKFEHYDPSLKVWSGFAFKSGSNFFYDRESKQLRIFVYDEGIHSFKRFNISIEHNSVSEVYVHVFELRDWLQKAEIRSFPHVDLDYTNKRVR
ncbi:hypothetical protein PCE1_000382 [Barthelona sp. PCE]